MRPLALFLTVQLHVTQAFAPPSCALKLHLNAPTSATELFNRAPKRRRFLQTVHHDHDADDNDKSASKTNTSNRWDKNIKSNDEQNKRQQFSQKIGKNADTTTTKTVDYYSIRKTKKPNKKLHPMMRTDLSLDDLEGVMMTRWGTEKKAQLQRAQESKESSALSKVRKRQQKNQYQKNNPKENDDDDDDGGGDAYEEPEYYDEDDEGYEDRYNVGISPKSVGGTGSSGFFFRENASDDSSSSQDRDIHIAPPSASSSSSPSSYSSNKSDVAVTPPKREKRETAPKIAPAPLLLDEDGEEQYLTLDQATKQMEQYLLSCTSQNPISNDDAENKNENENENVTEEDVQVEVTNTPPAATVQSFEELGITNPTLLSNLEQMKCSTPLPVQLKSCPLILAQYEEEKVEEEHENDNDNNNGKTRTATRDVLIGTHTGSGKTLAFLVPLVERILRQKNKFNNSSIKVLVVAPGRELASQIVSVAREVIQGTGMKVVLAIGGMPISRNVEQIRKNKPEIVVGTPGRLAELIFGNDGERYVFLHNVLNSTCISFILISFG